MEYEIIYNNNRTISLKIDGKLFDYKGETEFEYHTEYNIDGFIGLHLINGKDILIMPKGKLFKHKGITEFHFIGLSYDNKFVIELQPNFPQIEIPAEDIITSIEEDEQPIVTSSEDIQACTEEDNEPILENKSYIIKFYAQKLLQQLGETTLTPKQYEFIKLYYTQIIEQKENDDRIVDLFLDLMLEERK